ncbi:MAG TPA: indole-3-glycerol phosphate synthase TrpC [Polyangiaceae bacterium]|nr:indole-3-glycerol phosphate synthase TrpC [Polyangiaceae bacterium]
MGVLADILAEKAENIAALRARKLPTPPPRRPVSLRREPGEALRLIAEIKFRAPSAGALSTALGVSARAAAYERGGASMLSVLTDARFFGGAWEHVAEARAACELPLLCKEFVVDEVQLDAARSYGADAVLVIVRCVAQGRLRAIIEGARARELEPLVEITNDDEARVALDAGATIIGVNARDLDTLVMDAERAKRTLAALPDAVTKVHLSGLATPADVEKVQKTPAHAALIGETLMRADDPEPLLRSLVQAAKP